MNISIIPVFSTILSKKLYRNVSQCDDIHLKETNTEQLLFHFTIRFFIKNDQYFVVWQPNRWVIQ